VVAIGVITFVGLIAPHAARAIVGRPAQLPAGLMTAIVGAPYFVWLLHRSRLRLS
jgi:ferric hydroxamate transport system permease protein